MTPTVIRMHERDALRLRRDEFDEQTATFLLREHPTHVDVVPPSFRNDHQWVLTGLGYVGHIPLGPDRRLVIEPKVPLANLFAMLTRAYQEASFMVGTVSTGTIDDVYRQLAMALANGVLSRARQGLYRQYMPRHERATFVRGRLDLERLSRAPWETRLDCRCQEHTTDTEDNRILLWTLNTIMRTGLCDEPTSIIVRRAYHQLHHRAELVPLPASVCVDRAYNRLNQDYRPLHGLCHFFLDASGPTHQMGGHTMLPFLVDMDTLFETFVAKWLADNLPPGIRVEDQKRVRLSHTPAIDLRIDLVAYDTATNQPLCVLDTKYKDNVQSADITQVIAYAQSVGCHRAALVYPRAPAQPLSAVSGDIAIGSLVFDLDGDLDSAGERFLDMLCAWIGLPAARPLRSLGSRGLTAGSHIHSGGNP